MCTLKNRVCSPSATLRRLALAAAMGVLCTLAIANPPCPGDVDGNQVVDMGDVSMVLLDFGLCPVDPPAIASVSPAWTPTAGGITITITGTSLTDATSVLVKGRAATSVTVLNDTTLIAVTPPGKAGAADVQVTTPRGGTATITGAFTYSDAPPWGTVLEQAPNATVVPNASLRAAITATNLPWRVRDTGTGIEMVLIPPGTFTMGCSASNSYGCVSGENPTHQVTLTKALYMSRTEVTQAVWAAKMGSNPSRFNDRGERPVEQVSWYDVQAFCGTTGMRLPTEAEWEYAYRAGTTTAFHIMPGYLNGTNDDSQLGTIAWYGAGSGGSTNAVAAKVANGFGLYDMSGNVFEWCQDWYGTYASGAQTNPTGPDSGSYRVMRGGSWFYNSNSSRASCRASQGPVDRYDDMGFRVARNP